MRFNNTQTKKALNDVKLLNFNYFDGNNQVLMKEVNTMSSKLSKMKKITTNRGVTITSSSIDSFMDGSYLKFNKDIECKRNDCYNQNKEHYITSTINDIENTMYCLRNSKYNLNYNNAISTSTPIANNKTFSYKSSHDNTKPVISKIKQPSFEDDSEEEIISYNDDECEYNDNNTVDNNYYQNIAQQYSQLDTNLDESTQLNINTPPKLLESTFNSSSCSNMSNDLIILQHVPKSDEIKQSTCKSQQLLNFLNCENQLKYVYAFKLIIIFS